MKAARIPAIVATLALLAAFFLPWGYSSVIGPAYFRIKSFYISDYYFVALTAGPSSLFNMNPVGHVDPVLIRDVYVGDIATMILYTLALVSAVICLISKRALATLLSGVFAFGSFVSFFYAITMLGHVAAQESLTGPIALRPYTANYYLDVGALLVLAVGFINMVTIIIHTRSDRHRKRV